MGLSEAELAAVRAIERSGGVEDTLESFFAGAGDAQPVREVRVEPFLIARHPLTVAQVQHWLPEYEDDYANADSGTARLGSRTTWTSCSTRCHSGCLARPSGSMQPEPAPPP